MIRLGIDSEGRSWPEHGKSCNGIYDADAVCE